MPRFRSADIELKEVGKFHIEAIPNDFREDSSLSWIPYRAGTEFTANIKISSDITLNKAIRIICRLREPDGQHYTVIDHNLSSLPYSEPTLTRYLALKGEYILDITFLDGPQITAMKEIGEFMGKTRSCDTEEITGHDTLIFLENTTQDIWTRANRRLITFEALSQDIFLTKILQALTVALAVLGVGGLAKLFFGL